MTPDVLDVLWENLVLGLIGETIDDGDEICGCRVVDKSKKGTSRVVYRLELWTRSSNEDTVNQLKSRLNEVLVDSDGKGNNKGRSLDFEFKTR